jgi:flagellar basal body-associated protein FliL
MLILCATACLSTVGGVYGAVMWKTNAVESPEKESQGNVQLIKTRMVSVPIMADGQVLGYVVTRLQFSAFIDELKTSTVQPEPFVADEAFKRIYDTTPRDMKSGRKQALRELTADIATGVNKRLGRNVIKDVFIDSWAYLSKQDMIKNK